MNWPHEDLITWPANFVDQLIEVMDADLSVHEQRVQAEFDRLMQKYNG